MQNLKIFLPLVILLLVIIYTFSLFGGNTSPEGSFHRSEKVIVHKDPSCGCCGVYVSYLRRQGFEVEVDDNTDMDSIKDKFGIPSDLESCHTTEVGGYVVEGHIPVEVIDKLLSEKPEDITGIAMPGMPSGSPGMPGPKSDFIIHSLDGAENSVYMTL